MRWIVALGVAWSLGCAPAPDLIGPERDHVRLAPPEEVLVYDFWVAEEDVAAADAWTRSFADRFDADPLSPRAREIGRAVASALSAALVEKLRALGFEARRASGAPPSYRAVLVRGAFYRVGPGGRIVLGLPATADPLRSRVQVYYQDGSGPRLLEEYVSEADRAAGRSPLDHLDENADRAAAEIARTLQSLFAQQGWESTEAPA